MTAYVVTGWLAKWLIGAIFLVTILLWLWLSVLFIRAVDRFLIQPLLRRAIDRAIDRLEATEEES